MRHRSDLNQSIIIGELRKRGYTVFVLSTYCSIDLLVHAPGKLYQFVFEVKQEGEKLRPEQEKLNEKFEGTIYKITSADEAIRIMEEK